MIPTFVTPWHYIACNIKQTINILKANFTPLKLIQNCKLLSWLHHLSPHGIVQARDGGLLEEVQREEEAERSHLDHHACLEELLKYVELIPINITINICNLTHSSTLCMFGSLQSLSTYQHTSSYRWYGSPSFHHICNLTHSSTLTNKPKYSSDDILYQLKPPVVLITCPDHVS